MYRDYKTVTNKIVTDYHSKKLGAERGSIQSEQDFAAIVGLRVLSSPSLVVTTLRPLKNDASNTSLSFQGTTLRRSGEPVSIIRWTAPYPPRLSQVRVSIYHFSLASHPPPTLEEMPNSPSPEPDEPASNETQPTDSQSSMTVHPLGCSGMPMHMYPFPNDIVPTPPTRSKRRQVKNACTNCQKACKKCDDARPCLRCVKYGIAEECVDSHRKERKKGIKRGPYKKRDGKCTFVQIMDLIWPHHCIVFPLDPPYEGSVQQPIQMAATIPGASSTIPFISSVGFPPGLFGQYAPTPPKPGDPTIYYPQFYLATPIPAHGLPPHQNGDSEPIYHHPHFYPTTFLTPYPQPYTPYIMPHRPDGQVVLPSAHLGFSPINPRLPSGTGQQGQRDDRSEEVAPS